MNRLVLTVFAITSILFTNVACSRSSGPSGASSMAAESPQKAAFAAKPLDPKTLITEDKISRYMIYQKETISVAHLAMGAATDAYSKSGGSQKGFIKEYSKDERAAKMAEVQASALAKSGLEQREAIEIMKIVTIYTTKATIGTDQMKQAARNEASSKYGAEAVAVLDKHLPELSKLQDEMLAAAAGR